MTRPNLVLGLGGSLARDDAVGLVVARLLAADPRLPPDTEAVIGGADLLRLGPILLGRRHVVLVDAIAAEPGETEPIIGDDPLPGLDARQVHAHHLSPIQALGLLRLSDPGLSGTRFTWFLVPVATVSVAQELSPAMAARLPKLVDRILSLL